jgi:hypothetical protein
LNTADGFGEKAFSIMERRNDGNEWLLRHGIASGT